MIGKAQKIILAMIIAVIVIVEGATIGMYMKEKHDNDRLQADVDELTSDNKALFSENEALGDLVKQANAEKSQVVEQKQKELKGEPKYIISDKLGSLKYSVGTDLKKAKTGIVVSDKSLKSNPVFEMDNNKYGTQITSLGIDDVLTISDADGVMHQYKITKGKKMDKKPTAKDKEMVLYTKTAENDYYVIYASKTF